MLLTTGLQLPYFCNISSHSAPSDYTTVSTMLTFQPGEKRQVVPVSITNDDTNEEQEMFTATLSNPQGAKLGLGPTATINIDDDDGKSFHCAFIGIVVVTRARKRAG